MSFAVKFAISHALYYTRLLRLYQAIVLRRKAVVLMYHRVLTAEERRRTASHPALVVDRQTFAEQMAVLKREFTVLSTAEFADCVDGKRPFPNSSCLITFDDGWRDNYTNALPELRRYNLPAHIFLPTNYIGRRRLFWQEGLSHRVLQAMAEVRRTPARRGEFESLLAPAGLAHVLDLDPDRARASVIAAVSRQKPLTRPVLENLVERLGNALGVKDGDLSETDGFVTWEQVEEMRQQGVSFGGHGVEHHLLTQVSGDVADREIQGSKALVDERLKESVPTFSYPNGYLTSEIVEKVRSAGFKLAFETEEGFVAAGSEPMVLPRLNVHESATNSVPMFLARVVGLW